jgi:CheY-like chemotaxis protein
MIGEQDEALLRGLRVLVVEDDYAVADSTKMLLEDLGCVVLGPVSNPERAMEIVHTTDLDGVIMDINLHGQREYSLPEAISKQGIPVILTTGYLASNLPERLRRWPCLEKPVRQVDLAKTVHRTFAHGDDIAT